MGGGADSVRFVGGWILGGGKGLAWGTLSSPGFRSDLPSTCLIAAKSKPACTGISEVPTSPLLGVDGDFGGIDEAGAGVGVEAPSRGGNSSSSGILVS